jgi:secreted protein with Ig-like and vWFA domain
MGRPSKRTIISRQATAIHKRRRLAEAESQKIVDPVVPGPGEEEGDENDIPVENEGDKKDVPDEDEEENEAEAEEDEGDRDAVHQSLKTYINTLQVDNDADSEPAPLPEQAPQTAVDEPTPISQTGVYESGFRGQTPQQKMASGVKFDES